VNYPKCIIVRNKKEGEKMVQENKPMTILFVCSQNKLRSVLTSEALRAKRPDLIIESGGIGKEGRKFGRKANKRARDIIQSRYDVDISGYRSQAVTE